MSLEKVRNFLGNVAMMLMLIVFVWGIAQIMGSTVSASASAPDPSPRFQLLGREYHGSDPGNGPGQVFVYVDNALHEEIVCFAGLNRDTLSCYRSGRTR